MADATTRTSNFLFPIPDVDEKPWQDLYSEFVKSVDALFARFTVVNDYVGVWDNAVLFSVDEVALDLDDATMYKCLVKHTSALGTTTFAEDRAANTTYWESVTVQETFQGEWAAGTSYTVRDFAVASGKYAVALVTHTSGATFAADLALGYWLVLIDTSSTGYPDPAGSPDKWVVVNALGTAYELISASTASTRLGSMIGANNLSELADTGTARTNLGLGSAAILVNTDLLFVVNDLSDLANAGTARGNLGLGSSAVIDTGTSGAKVPLLNAGNTWAASQIANGAGVIWRVKTDGDTGSNTMGFDFENDSGVRTGLIFGTGEASASTILRIMSEGNVQLHAGETGFIVGTPRLTAFAGGGVNIGAPTGGDKGTGALNAVTLYKNGVELVAPSQAEAEAGTVTTVRTFTAERVKQAIKALALVPASAQATTSGTAFNFTGIPAGANRITVVFNGVSMNGTTDEMLVQIGDSGGLETSGYVASSLLTTTIGQAGSNSTTGFNIHNDSAANAFSGQMVLTRVSGNIWVASHQGKNATTGALVGGGDKTLTGELDRLTLLRSGSTDSFDAGSVNIFVE